MRVETEIVDGKERIWFPAVEYENVETKERTRYPPPYPNRYLLITSNHHELRELASSGKLYDTRHRGFDIKFIDRRSVK